MTAAGSQARRQHEEDMAKIGERLFELAERESWCDLFWEEVADINTQLNVPLPIRRTEDNGELELRIIGIQGMPVGADGYVDKKQVDEFVTKVGKLFVEHFNPESYENDDWDYHGGY